MPQSKTNILEDLKKIDNEINRERKSYYTIRQNMSRHSLQPSLDMQIEKKSITRVANPDQLIPTFKI